MRKLIDGLRAFMAQLKKKLLRWNFPISTVNLFYRQSVCKRKQMKRNLLTKKPLQSSKKLLQLFIRYSAAKVPSALTV